VLKKGCAMSLSKMKRNQMGVKGVLIEGKNYDC